MKRSYHRIRDIDERYLPIVRHKDIYSFVAAIQHDYRNIVYFILCLCANTQIRSADFLYIIGAVINCLNGSGVSKGNVDRFIFADFIL